MTAQEIMTYMESLHNDEQRKILMGFRYALEKMDEEERRQWVDVKVFSTKSTSY